jgi:GT2 family glycosyltransferase
MEASRFWKLRNVWHGLKARLGLSNGALPPYPPFENLVGTAPAYETWRERNAPRPSDVLRMREHSAALRVQPLISVVVATYNTPERYLRAMLESVFAQAYERWELCIADDASSMPEVAAVLREYAARDSRVRVLFRTENGHISRATNSALSLASGEFVAFVDHDDLLSPDALYEIAAALARRPETDILYSDEDKIDDAGNFSEPHFKPDWCPESFLSRMYVGHLLVCRRTALEAAGAFRSDFDGSQDYDLVLRLSERTERIVHIPRVLYHWRVHAASTAAAASVKSYARGAAERALNAALERRGEIGRIEALPDSPGVYGVRFEIGQVRRVSVIVPTRDHGAEVERCLKAALGHTAYPDLEVILVDNGSTDVTSLELFTALAAADRRITVLRLDEPFNFSKLNNQAVARSSGEYLLFLNNDTEPISEGWIESLVEYAQRPSIGAVGALLLYRDDTVQHAGVVLGLGGVAGHSHKHFPAGAPGYFYMLRAVNNYSAVTAACMMVRREVFERAGRFDESLAVAFNDVDFCLRVREAGFRNVYLPHVVLYHDESKSRGPETQPGSVERFRGEIETMKQRWPVLALGDPCYNPNLTLDREDFSIGP